MHPEEIPVWKPFLKHIPLFKDLSGEDLGRIAALLKSLSLPRGAVLFHQGDPADAFFIITSGQVRLETGQGARRVIKGYAGRGDTLGELALLTGEPRAMSVLLESTTEFLVLSKKDFAAVLRDNPSILLQLSRTLSSRIIRETHGKEAEKASQPQVMALLSSLEGDIRSLFILHLALAVVEQSRRRVLLVDMDPAGGVLAKALGLKPVKVTEEMLRGHDLHDPKILEKFVSVHASGMGVLTIPPGVLAGRLFRSIFLFMNLLRERCDFSLISLPGELGDVEKSVLNESDLWVLAGRDENKDGFMRQRTALGRFMPAPKKLMDVWLGERRPDGLVRSTGGEWVRIPWPAELTASYRSGTSLFRVLDEHPRTRHGVERLARRFAHLRVGLAMGTGAALGLSLVGILKVFEREHIPIDLIAGTSMGSLIGGLYSLGIGPDGLDEIVTGIDKAWMWENLFWDLTFPRSGFFEGTTLLRFVRSYFEKKEFHDLDIPFSCVATDIERGEPVIFREGRVAEAIRASCGIPLVFQPFQYQGRFLVDGGLVEPNPVGVVRQMGADVTISVNLTMPAGERKTSWKQEEERPKPKLDIKKLKEMTLPQALKAPSMARVFFQMIYTMEYEIAKSRAELADVYIHPDLSGFSWTELHRGGELIRAGEKVAEGVLPKIKSLVPYFSDYCKVSLNKSPW